MTEIDKKTNVVIQELSACPAGRMIKTQSHGKPVIMHVTGQGKGRCRRIITTDRGLQVKLARKSVLEKELRVLEQRSDVLQSAVREISRIGSFDKKRFAIESFGWMSDEEIEECCFPKRGGKWENGPYEKLNYLPEELRHTTSRGLKVRSKSELLIAEALSRHDLPFRYEQVYHTGKLTISADFTIRRADGRLFVWEHEGMINVRTYTGWQRKKADLYASIGFFPWDNMIVTYDTEDGNIDLRIVESEIINKLLI